MASGINWIDRVIVPCFLVLVQSVALHVSAQRRQPPRNPQEVRHSFRFRSGTSAQKIPFELSANLIVLQVRVNNSRPLSFLLDTGAGVSVIDPRTAKALGLKVQGKLSLDATGGSVESALFKGVSFAFPGVEVFDQTLAAIPLDSFSLIFGHRLDGIVGYDFIKQFVVEIDYAAGLINLYDPRSYRYSGSGESVPITLVENAPYAHAKILQEDHDPIEGKFEMDTGSTGTLNVNTPFVNAHKLLETVPNLVQSTLGGAGGQSKAVKGRVKGVQLGSFVIEGPVVSFSQATKGNEASSRSDGEIGGALFRRFKVIFDYSGVRMILERNASFLEAEDLSGIEVFAEGPHFKTFVVNAVAANSPASEAGLREEDVIVAINGRPAGRLTLTQIRQMFMQDGKEYVLSIKRDEKIMQVKIKLRRVS